eukprot:3021441-Amphidinium_carterae.1
MLALTSFPGQKQTIEANKTCRRGALKVAYVSCASLALGSGSTMSDSALLETREVKCEVMEKPAKLLVGFAEQTRHPFQLGLLEPISLLHEVAC